MHAPNADSSLELPSTRVYVNMESQEFKLKHKFGRLTQPTDEGGEHYRPFVVQF